MYSVATQNLYHDGLGQGPYTTTLVGDMSSVPDGTQTTIHVTSTWDAANWGAAPSGWADGELTSTNPDHFLITVQPGDDFQIGSEYVKLVTKTSSSVWVVQRGISSAGTNGGGNEPTHPSGTTIIPICQAVDNVSTGNNGGGGYLHWDFVDSPDGTNPADWKVDFGSHPVSRGNYRVDSGYLFRYGAITNKSLWGTGPTGGVTSHPYFGGQQAAGDGNGYQKHVSMASGNDSLFFDSTYFVGGGLFSVANSSAVQSLGGSLYQYSEAGAPAVAYGTGSVLARKHFPTVAKTYGQTLVDVSGPGVILGSGSSDNYKYCIANADGECHAGSHKNDEFFNLPNLDNFWCSGGENPTALHDICMGNFAAMGVAVMQYKTVNDSTGALSYRPLARTFANFGGMNGNIKLTYAGEWALYHVVDLGDPNPASRIFALKVPPVPADDGINRGSFIPSPLTITPPSGQGITAARVKFGYAEQGSPANYYCTSRREQCVATGSSVNTSNPFSFAQTDSYSPTPCTTSCTIALPVYPLHTAYYQVEYLNAGGQVVALGDQGVSVENNAIGGSSSGGLPDTTPPTLSSIIASSITRSSAAISWSTNESSDTQVEYGATTSYGSSTTLNTSGISSHSVSLSGLSAGTLYHYRAKSRDTAGNLAVSVDLTFTTSAALDTTPPVVSVTAPLNNATVSNSITISATASDPAVSGALTSGLANVVFKVDGIVLVTDVSSPYSATLNTATLSNGTHTITARATDNASNLSALATITVTANNSVAPPPTPTLTVVLSASPNTGAAPISGVSLTAALTGTAAGNSNYYFYCNRNDTTTGTSTPPEVKYASDPNNPKTASSLCSYTTAGTYIAKVIVERNGLVSESRTNITISSPAPAAASPPSGGGSPAGSGGSVTVGGSAPVVVNVPPPTATPTAPPAAPSSSLELINDNGTFYLINNNQKFGITSPGILYSYGFEFKDATVASSADLAMPQGSLLLPGNGYLVKSDQDKTVYLISQNQRYAFVSEGVFRSLGFSFDHVFNVTDPELQSLPQAANIDNAQSQHLPGVDINRNGTIYWVSADNKLHGYPSLAVYNSWHRDSDFSQVVPANSSDLLMPVGEPVTMRVVE